jgi:hypothetical protein
VEIAANWHLDESVHDRRELAVPLQEGIHFLSATIADHDLAWHLEKEAGAGPQTAIVELPAAKDRLPVHVAVRAWQPLLLDQDWQLPRLRPEAVFWQSGAIDVSIDSTLEMRSFASQDCLQTGVSPADDAANAPETLRLVSYSPAAEVTVKVARPRAEAVLRLGSSLALIDPDINGRLATELAVVQGSVHEFTGEVGPGWIIEAVETAPADALGEWFIDTRGARRHIEIQLSRAARPGRGVTVIIRGRLQRAGVGDAIPAGTLRMVDWADFPVERHLLTFQTVEPYAVEPVGDLPVVTKDEVDERDEARLHLPSGRETIFDVTHAGQTEGLKLTLERAQFEADVRIDATYVERAISNVYHLTVDSATNGFDRLLVYSTAPLGDEVRWIDKRFNAPLAAERLPTDDARRSGLPTAGELWLVRLPAPTPDRVEVAATVTIPLEGRRQLPLLALPEARRQQGQVFVRAELPVMPWLDPQGLPPAALPAAAKSPNAKGLPPVRAAYRYDPAGCLSAAGAPQLGIRPGTANQTPLVIAQHVDLESFFWANGRAVHRATYKLANEGATSFPLRVPADAEIRAVVINGRTVEQSGIVRSGDSALVPLDQAVRATRVFVHFETRGAPLVVGTSLEPPLVQNEIPILAGRWTIWLPQEFSTAVADAPATGDSSNWRRRLFGPLGRPADKMPFRPTRSQDWAALFSSLGSWPVGIEPSKTGLLGWVPYRANFVVAQPAAVTLAHPPKTTSWAVALFLICLVAGQLLRRHVLIFVVLLALAAVLALALPSPLAPLATGAVLGLSLSMLLGWPRSEFDPDAGGHSWGRASTVSLTSLLLSLFAAKLALAAPAGEPAASRDAKSPAAIERVLIPVDSDGRRTGSKYYVSERFLRALLPRGAGDFRSSLRWVLHDAVYAGELRERTDPPSVVAGDWSIVYDIEVFARDTTVVLPLVRNEATWRDTAMLDGVPVPLLWSRDGCAVEIDEPGRYSLALSLTPQTIETARRHSLALTIPPLAGTRLQLKYPKSLSGLTIAGAAGERPESPTPGELMQSLSAIGQLELEWLPVARPTASANRGRRVAARSQVHR